MAWCRASWVMMLMQKNTMDVSVVVTVGHDSLRVRKYIASIRGRSWPGVEFLFVVAGSSDDLLGAGGNVDPSLTCACHELCLHGQWDNAKGRRLGLGKAIGRYVLFLDAATWRHLTLLQSWLALADQGRADIVLADPFHDQAVVSFGNSHGCRATSTHGPMDGIRLFDALIMQGSEIGDRAFQWTGKLFRRCLLQGWGRTLGVLTLADGLGAILPVLAARRCVLAATDAHVAPYALAKKSGRGGVKARVNGYLALRKGLQIQGLLGRYRNAIIRLFMQRNFGVEITLEQAVIARQLAKREQAWTEVVVYLRCRDRLLCDALIALVDRRERGDGGSITPVTRRWQHLMVVSSKVGDGHSGNASKPRPVVSIVTVTHNILAEHRQEFFQQMIASVMGQSMGRDRIEHLVVDGGSVDGTVEWLMTLHGDGKIDAFVSEPDTGIYEAMNRGSMYAKGQYILYLNSDDWLQPNALEVLLAGIMKSGADYGFANAERVDENGRSLGLSVANMDKIYFGTPYCHQTVLCRTGCFINAYFDEEFRITMWSQALKLFMLGYKYVYIPETLASFRVGGLSSSAATAKEIDQERGRIKDTVVLPLLPINRSEYDAMDIQRRRAHQSQEVFGFGRRLDCDGQALSWFARDFFAAFKRLTCSS